MRNPSPVSPLWCAAAAAAIGAATAYALSQRRKREEEEARQAAEAHAEAARRNAAEEARKAQNWLQGNAMLAAALKQSGLSQAEQAALRAQARAKGVGIGLGLIGAAVAAAQAKRQSAARQAARSDRALDAHDAQADRARAARTQQSAAAYALPENFSLHHKGAASAEKVGCTNQSVRFRLFANSMYRACR